MGTPNTTAKHSICPQNTRPQPCSFIAELLVVLEKAFPGLEKPFLLESLEKLPTAPPKGLEKPLLPLFWKR